jgi:hypothetical protein
VIGGLLVQDFERSSDLERRASLFVRGDLRSASIPNAYPVYTIGYSNSVQTILDALHPIVNLDTIGRAGLFFYSHLHDQLRFGKDYVQALMQTDEAATSLSASAY